MREWPMRVSSPVPGCRPLTACPGQDGTARHVDMDVRGAHLPDFFGSFFAGRTRLQAMMGIAEIPATRPTGTVAPRQFINLCSLTYGGTKPSRKGAETESAPTVSGPTAIGAKPRWDGARAQSWGISYRFRPHGRPKRPPFRPCCRANLRSSPTNASNLSVA